MGLEPSNAIISLLYLMPWRDIRLADERAQQRFEGISADLGHQFAAQAAIGYVDNDIVRLQYKVSAFLLSLHWSIDNLRTLPKIDLVFSVYGQLKCASLLINVRMDDFIGTEEAIAFLQSAGGAVDENKPGESRSPMIIWRGATLKSIRAVAERAMDEFRADMIEAKGLSLVRSASKTPRTTLSEDSLSAAIWLSGIFPRPRRLIEIRMEGSDPSDVVRRQTLDLYGLMTTDEGYPFYPPTQAISRLSSTWQSRAHFLVCALGRSTLVINNKPVAYKDHQEAFTKSYFGTVRPMDQVDNLIAGLDMGAFRANENLMVAQFLQESAGTQLLGYSNLLRGLSVDPLTTNTPAAWRFGSYAVNSPKLFLSVLSATWNRAEIFRRRIEVADEVRRLAMMPLRELGELGHVLNKEQGIDTGAKEVRDRLAELDAEFNVLALSYVNILLVLLAAAAVLIALLQFAAPLLSSPPSPHHNEASKR